MNRIIMAALAAGTLVATSAAATAQGNIRIDGRAGVGNTEARGGTTVQMRQNMPRQDLGVRSDVRRTTSPGASRYAPGQIKRRTGADSARDYAPGRNPRVEPPGQRMR